MRDFCITDPSGVCWRIGQNVDWALDLGTVIWRIDDKARKINSQSLKVQNDFFNNS
jgi:hypothetical protein